MRIRAATLSDASAIAKIHVDGWRHAYRELLPASVLEGLSYTQREANWSKWISENKGVVYVAEDRGVVIGYISGSREGALVRIVGLYLSPASIGKGVGKALLSHFENEMKPTALSLMVLKGNAPAIAFYERNGFVFTGKTDYLQVGGQRFVEQEMRKELI